jgi:hypothetical protein
MVIPIILNPVTVVGLWKVGVRGTKDFLIFTADQLGPKKCRVRALMHAGGDDSDSRKIVELTREEVIERMRSLVFKTAPEEAEQAIERVEVLVENGDLAAFAAKLAALKGFVVGPVDSDTTDPKDLN